MQTEPKSLALDTQDESEVLRIVNEFANTWNRHDMQAMHELNTDDVEWVNVTGNHWRGNPAVFRGHNNIHQTIFAKTQMSVEKTVIRAITPNAAIVVATMYFGPTIDPYGQVQEKIKTRGSFVLVKQEGVWKITHFQNTIIDLIAEEHDPITWDETGWLPGQGNP